MRKPRGKEWTHRKHGGVKVRFVGTYTKPEGERAFVLKEGKKKIKYESWQQARSDGWVMHT